MLNIIINVIIIIITARGWKSLVLNAFADWLF